MVQHPHCPVSFRKVDERATRLTAACVFAFSFVYLIYPHWSTAVVLLVDFSLRCFSLAAYSPFARFGRWTARRSSSRRQPVDAAPKQFAAWIGFLLSDLLLIASFISPDYAGRPLAFVLLLFSFLESAFGFCAACKLYPYVKDMLGATAASRQQVE